MIDDQEGMPSSVTFEDIEASLAAPPPAQALDKMTLEGDLVPENLRGKTAADLVAETEKLREALRISEQAREMAKLTARVDAASAPPPPPPPTPPKEYTNEELKTLMEEEPLKAIEVMQQQAELRVAKNFGSRLDSLTSGTIAAAEQSARQRYSEEFEALGPEINEALTRIPDKSALASGNTWDEFIAYIRGKHFEKYYTYKVAKTRPTPEQVRAEQAASAGFSPPPATRGSAPAGNYKPLDDTEKEIIKILGVSAADYRKYGG